MRIRPALLLAPVLGALLLAGCMTPPTVETSEPPAQGAPGSETPAPTSTAPAGDGREYAPCPDALVNNWLHYGSGGDATAADFGPRPVGWGTQPTGDAEVLCSIALDQPEGDYTHVLTVLTGDTVAEAVATAAEAEELEPFESGQTGAVASYTAHDDAISYTLFGPPDQILMQSGIAGGDTAYLLEGTIAITAD